MCSLSLSLSLSLSASSISISVSLSISPAPFPPSPLLSPSPWCRMLRWFVALCTLAVCWAQDCQVANVQVMQNFDRSRVSSNTQAAAVVSNLWQPSPHGFRLVQCSYSMADF